MNNTFFSNAFNRVLATVAMIALVAALFAYAYYTLKQADYMYMGPTTISVTGEGEVLAVPDIGQFSFSVTATAPEAKAAQADAASKTNEIIAYLREQGIEERDIKTEQYSLYPKYRWEERVCAIGMPCTPGEQVQDGFEVSQSVSVKVRDLDKAGDLITGAGERGATNLSGLTFTIDDQDSLKAEARALAIADAKEKSKELAKELGVRIVRMNGYYEDEGGYPSPYAYGGDMAMNERAMAATPESAPELPAGESATKSRITITYVVK